MPPEKAQEEKTSFLHIKISPQQKHAWVRSSQRRGMKLADWVTETLNEETRRTGINPPDPS